MAVINSEEQNQVPSPVLPPAPQSIQEQRVEKPKEQPKKPVSMMERPTVRFSDLIGLERVKKILRENVIVALKHPELWTQYKQERGIGIIFYGSPGTGKTSLTRALAGEAGIPIIIAKITDIIKPYTGQSEEQMHKIFQQARSCAPSILFFDEIDGLGTKRNALGGEGTAEVMKLVMDVFLQEMDGIDTSHDNIFVIGATNQPFEVDPALKRAGRFEDSVYFSPPTYKERKELFKYYLRDKPKSKINYGRLARSTMGYSQSDIRSICRKTGVYAINKVVNSNDFETLHKINTLDILKILSDPETGRDTLTEWFNNLYKDLNLKVGKKKKKQGPEKLTEDDKRLYKDLIRDIKQRKKDRNIIGAMRWFSMHIA